MSTPKNIPKTLAACADRLYVLRQQRLEIERRAEELKSEERALKVHLINALPKSDANGVEGRVARARITVKDVPTLEDAAALKRYIKRYGAADLLEVKETLSTKAVRERWKDGKAIPGVGVFHAVDVSCTKV